MTMLDWDHSYWKEWLSLYFSHQMISKPMHFYCPDWRRGVLYDKVKELLNDEQKEKLNEFLEQERVDKDPNLYWCPKTDWGRYVEVKNAEKGTKHKGSFWSKLII